MIYKRTCVPYITNIHSRGKRTEKNVEKKIKTYTYILNVVEQKHEIHLMKITKEKKKLVVCKKILGDEHDFSFDEKKMNYVCLLNVLSFCLIFDFFELHKRIK